MHRKYLVQIYQNTPYFKLKKYFFLHIFSSFFANVDQKKFFCKHLICICGAPKETFLRAERKIFFWILKKTNQIWFVITYFRLIWHRMNSTQEEIENPSVSYFCDVQEGVSGSTLLHSKSVWNFKRVQKKGCNFYEFKLIPNKT